MKCLNRTIEYGLYLLVFLLPLQTRWIIKPGVLNHGPWEYGTYSLYGTDILLIFILLLFILNKFSIFRPKADPPRADNFQFSNNNQLSNFQTNKKPWLIWLFIFGLVLVSAVSVFFAADKSLSLFKLGWLTLGVGLFWLVRTVGYDRLKLYFSLLSGLALQAGLGIWQFLSQTAPSSKWLGLAAHRASELGTSVIQTVGPDGIGERWLRAYGGLDHPNVLGGLIAIGILFLIGEIIGLEKLCKFSIFNFQFSNKLQILISKYLKIILWTLLILFTAALFFSFSRSAWLGLSAGLAVLIIWSAVKKDLTAEKAMAQVILISSAVAFILFLMYPNLVIMRLYPVKYQSIIGTQSIFNGGNGSNRLEIKSSSERIESIKNSWPIIKKHWAGGAGLGGATLAISQEVKSGEQSYYYQPAHNVLLLVWSEIGIFGMLFFLGLIIYLIIFNFKFLKPSLKIENYKLKIWENDYTINPIFNISVLTALIVLMSLDHWLWSLHFGVLFFWLALGMAAHNR